MLRVLISVSLGLSLAACQIGPRASSPDVLYSKNATEARALQVPPDLSNVAEGEQFVLPGNAGGTITRNTLLPESANLRFVRQGDENFLEIQNTPEDIWPQIQEFLRSEQYPISQSEPIAGVVTSQWRKRSGSVVRVAFRLERGDGNSTRLFTRRQVADDAGATMDADDVWPPFTHDSEKTSELLVRLMVFLGVEEQRALGILNDQDVSAILDDATVKSTSLLTYMDVHRGFLPAFEVVDSALKRISGTAVTSDRASGKLVGTVEGALVAYEIFPVTSIATRVIMDPAAKLSQELTLKFLNTLLEEII